VAIEFGRRLGHDRRTGKPGATMSDSVRHDSGPKSVLDEISTRWAQIGDPMQFVMRYGTAIRKYLVAMLDRVEDAAEVEQEFLAKMVEHRFAGANPDQGKFRKYLKTAVRNAALMHIRRQRTTKKLESNYAEHLEATGGQSTADTEYLDAWRRCVIDRVFTAMHREERAARDNSFYTVLRTFLDHENEDSAAQAARASKSLGRPIKSDNFRKQLSRARRRFAELLVHEVALTIQDRTAETVEDELVETGLMETIRVFLPGDWRSWDFLSSV
jgi:DNA-directed RNA polymerase specialized sigma24 family protein